jgi:hypothetical protein
VGGGYKRDSHLLQPACVQEFLVVVNTVIDERNMYEGKLDAVWLNGRLVWRNACPLLCIDPPLLACNEVLISSCSRACRANPVLDDTMVEKRECGRLVVFSLCGGGGWDAATGEVGKLAFCVLTVQAVTSLGSGRFYDDGKVRCRIVVRS